MSVIDTLVFNRAQTDVDRWETLGNKGFAAMTAEEKREWLRGMKGSYNASDLNRVASAMQYLSARFREYGYASAVTSRTDWTVADVPTQGDMDGYLDDLRRLRAVFTALSTTPEVPGDMDGLTWQEANDIEKNLTDIDLLLTNMAAAWFYSGEIYAGEV